LLFFYSTFSDRFCFTVLVVEGRAPCCFVSDWRGVCCFGLLLAGCVVNASMLGRALTSLRGSCLTVPSSCKFTCWGSVWLLRWCSSAELRLLQHSGQKGLLTLSASFLSRRR